MTSIIDDTIQVQTTLLAGGSDLDDLGTMLFLTTEASVLDASGSGRVGIYDSFAEVAAAGFASSTAPYTAAQIYFSQVPRPRRIAIGRMATTAAATTVTGGANPNENAIDDLATGTFTFGGTTIAAVDMQSQNTHASQASELQRLLRADSDGRFSNITVTFTNSRFVISDPDGTDYGGAPTGNLADLMKLSANEGAVYSTGGSAEDPTDSLDEIAGLASFHFLATDAAVKATNGAHLSCSRWAQANGVMYSAGTSGTDALGVNEAATVTAQLAALGNSRTFISWSSSDSHLDVSAAARMAAINFAQAGTFATLNLRTMPGITPDRLTTTQKNELDRKHVNYYRTDAGAVPVYQTGTTINDGRWVDTQVWIDALVRRIKNATFSLLRRENAVPQTGAGLMAIRGEIRSVLEEGVLNGGIAPGTVSAAMRQDIIRTTGNAEFDGILSQGYLIHIGRLSDQSSADRDARKSPPVNVWMKGSGAIQQISVNLVFEN